MRPRLRALLKAPLSVAIACLLPAVATGAASTGEAAAAPAARAAAVAGAPAAAAPIATAAEVEAIVAQMHASFNPDKLGTPTTVGFGFTLRTSGDLAPPALTSMDIHMPKGMNYLHTTLGLATCSRGRILARGAAGCPANSVLGFGSAFVEVPFGKGAGKELPRIEAFMAPPNHEDMVVLFYANGETPVFAQLVFSGEVLPDAGIYGSQLSAAVPVVPSVTDGPDVAIVRVHASLGPNKVTYERRVKGRLQRFHPRGIETPAHCPKGGFPFEADFAFQNGETAHASTTVPCPKGAHVAGRHRRRG